MTQENGGWFTDQQALLVLVLIFTALAVMIIVPYLQYILLAIILAYVMWPLQVRLRRTRLSPVAAALSLTVLTLVIILLPVVLILSFAAQEALALLDAFERGELNLQVVEAELANLGIAVDLTQMYSQHRVRITGAIEALAWSILDLARSVPRIIIGIAITLFVFFVLLRDGEKLLAWVQHILPVRDDVQSEMMERLNRLMYASVVGNVAASGIQAVALGVGLWVLGFENISILVVITFVAALLPLVGAFVVWVPLVGYLALIGRPEAAVGLFIFGSLVSISDFYTRPLVIGHSAALNSATIVVGVFGGLVAFGAIGLLIGPVVLGAAKISLDILARERNNDRNNAVDA